MLTFVGDLSLLRADFPDQNRSFIVDFQIVGDHGEITIIHFETTDGSGAVFMALTYNEAKHLFIKMAVQKVPDLKALYSEQGVLISRNYLLRTRTRSDPARVVQPAAASAEARFPQIYYVNEAKKLVSIQVQYVQTIVSDPDKGKESVHENLITEISFG